MEYQLEITENADYVSAILGGVRTPESLVAIASETTIFCKKQGYSRLLIDIRGMSGSLDTLETFEVAGHDIPKQKAVRSLVRSAIVDHTENIERIRFFETVAVNRGLNIRVFDDEDRAIEWLREGELGASAR